VHVKSTLKDVWGFFRSIGPCTKEIHPTVILNLVNQIDPTAASFSYRKLSRFDKIGPTRAQEILLAYGIPKEEDEL